MAKWFGFNPPFLGGAQNVMSKQMDERLIKNDIMQLLLTLPGERVHRPDFGTQLRSYPFELMDDQAEMDILRGDIQDKLEKYEERVRVNRVDVLASDASPHLLVVNVDVSPNDQPLVHYLVEVKLSKSGGA